MKIFILLHVSLFCMQTFGAQQAWLGMELGKDVNGVIIEGLFVDTAADKAGLLPGDVVTIVDQKKMAQPKDLIDYIKSKKIGDQIKMTFVREGKTQQKTIKLEGRPDEKQMLKNLHLGKPLKNYSLDVYTYNPNKNSVEKSTQKISELKGRNIILKFWATWCPACLSTHSTLNRLYAKPQATELFAVTDEDEKIIEAFILKKKPNFKIVRDKKHTIRKDWFFSAIPSWVVIDKKGIVTTIENGAGPILDKVWSAAK